MKRNQVLGVVIDAIFAETSEFDDIEDIKEDSNLSSDMAMDSLDLVEVIMDIEKMTGEYIPDEVFLNTPCDEITVGSLTDMLYVYFKDK
jgi:acyl carrier protein